MKTFPGVWSHACYGILLGAFGGLLAGGTEYLILFLNHALSSDLAKAYWDILLPYAICGTLGGLLVAVSTALWCGVDSLLSRHLAQLFAVFSASIIAAYLLVWTTYQLGVPAWKLSNGFAYLACLVAAFSLGRVLSHVFGAIFRRLEGAGGLSVSRLRTSVILSLSVVIVGFVGLAGLIGEGTHSSRFTHQARQVTAERPNIVFILIDTLRADHLPVYGYSRQTAPNLTKFAQQGMLSTRMYAPAASTKPSVASLFSSVYPSVHKVHDNYDSLSDSHIVVSEILQAAGYVTFGVSANANVSPTFGYAQGFDEFRVWKTESTFRLTLMGRLAEDVLGTTRLSQLLGERQEIVPKAEVITDIALEWAQANSRGPVFLYVQYIDPHDPYSPPAPYDQSFDYLSAPPVRGANVNPLGLVSDDVGQQWVGQTLDQYDGEILYTDDHIGRLLARLTELGILENALVIITSDHGEEFFEHGKLGHGKSVYDEVLHVPFLMQWPGHILPGSMYTEIASLVDVMPTLLELLEIPIPPSSQGLSFAAQLTTSNNAQEERQIFAQVSQDHFSMEMIRDKKFKFIRHLHGPQQDQQEFYDLEQDPLERNNVALQEEPPRMAALRAELDVFREFATQVANLVPDEHVEKLDKDTERALRSLGYIK